MGIISIELYVVRTRKWNYERVIVFQSVILQHAQGDNNSKHIYVCILFQLDFWYCMAFDEIIKDTFKSATCYLEKDVVLKPRINVIERSQTSS